MNIQSFLRLLTHVHGPNASGEWMARCPCHDDKTASLSVCVKRDAGRDRIVFDCKAGCDGRDILYDKRTDPAQTIEDFADSVRDMVIYSVGAFAAAGDD